MRRNPWLVQRCELEKGELKYDYMGSAEFEFGEQSRSLKRIFSSVFFLNTTTVKIGEKDVTVYTVAGKDFDVAEYQPYLQQMAERKLRLKERTDFDRVIEVQLGLNNDTDRIWSTNVWFDLDNDVLWTLTEENQRDLVSKLDEIKELWAKK